MLYPGGQNLAAGIWLLDSQPAPVAGGALARENESLGLERLRGKPRVGDGTITPWRLCDARGE